MSCIRMFRVIFSVEESVSTVQNFLLSIGRIVYQLVKLENKLTEGWF